MRLAYSFRLFNRYSYCFSDVKCSVILSWKIVYPDSCKALQMFDGSLSASIKVCFCSSLFFRCQLLARFRYTEFVYVLFLQRSNTVLNVCIGFKLVVDESILGTDLNHLPF